MGINTERQAMKIIIETDRLLLREFVIDDVHDLFRMTSDPDVTRYTGDDCKTLEDARKGLEERLFRDYEKHGYGRWAAVYKRIGRVIGFAGLKYLDDVGEVDLGYRLFKEHWGRGLATEAGRAVLAYGVETLQLQRVIGIADIENKASTRVLEKVGFTFEEFTTYRGMKLLGTALRNEDRADRSGQGDGAPCLAVFIIAVSSVVLVENGACVGHGRRAAPSCPQNQPIALMAPTTGRTATTKPVATIGQVEISTRIRGPLSAIMTAVSGVVPAELPPGGGRRAPCGSKLPNEFS